MIGDKGSGFVRCRGGHRHWGRFGAAGLLLWSGGSHASVLLQQRSRLVQQAGSWGLPGGALHRGEPALEGALRETAEETDLDVGAVAVGDHLVDDHGGWSFTTVLGRLDDPVDVRGRGWEVADMRWFPVSTAPGLRLHPGLAATWPRLVVLLR